MSRPTDHANLNLSRLHRDVVFGRAGGKIIWQPPIHCWFDDKMFAGKPLPAPYEGMTRPELYRALGCSSRIYEYNACFRRIEHPSVSISSSWLNETDEEITIETPVGRQVAVQRRTISSSAYIVVKWQVATEEELKVATWREENTTWEWDASQYEAVRAEWGDLGAPTVYLPRMNVQSLYLEKMGVENAIYALADFPDTVEAYFRALEASHDRLIEVVNASPIEIINFGENVHAGTLTPELFLKYHLPACRRRCEKLHAPNKFVHAHWDGDCAPLLPYAKETGLDGIDAVTPAPQGDVTLAQVKDALGDDLFLIGGIPAVYFDATFSEETLIECAREVIDLFAPKLILGISDELSSTGEIERVRLIGDIVDDYNASV